MKDYDFIKETIKHMLSDKRFKHSLGVEIESVKLGHIYNENIEKCKIAAIAHDCVKNYSNMMLLSEAKKYGLKIDSVQENTPQLLHGPVGAIFCKNEFGIDDYDILNSIYYHTTGRKNMSLLEKIIYLADIIEETRTFTEVDKIRSLSKKNINEALILSCDCTLLYIIKNNQLIHPLTVEFRNSLLTKDVK